MKKSLPASNGGVIALLAAALFAVNWGVPSSHAATEAAPALVPPAIEVEGGGRKAPPDHDVNDEGMLTPFVIFGRGKLRLTWAEKMKWDLFWDGRFGLGFALPGPGPYVFTPGRLAQQEWKASQTARVVEGGELKKAPSSSLAGSFRSELAFDLVRRRNSNPASRFAPSVALRGVSALVLLDGVPINDPFDGRVPWTTIPREGVARAELVPGGGATAWGNGALGGVVQFLTLPARGQMINVSVPSVHDGPDEPVRTKNVIVGATQLTAMLGDFDTRSTEFASSLPTAKGVVQVLGGIFRTDGGPVVAAEQRGPVDTAAGTRTRWLGARWRQLLGSDIEMVATVRGRDESYGAGTSYQQGRSRGTFASVALAGHHPGILYWNALIYIQSDSSVTRFSAVNASRTIETPVIDQFDRPTKTFGANWTGSRLHQGNTWTHFGVDFRVVRGESHDKVDFENGVFTRQLAAGGRQDSLGLFVLHDREFTPSLHATIGARIDAWRESNGHRRETDLLTQVIAIDERYRPDHGTEFGPNLGMVWHPNKAWSWRVNGQQSFRRPTLHELYHTSGSDSLVTKANPALQIERNTSVEVATEYSLFREKTSRGSPRRPVLTLGAKAFVNELRDAIGGIGIVRGTGELPMLDTLPAGYRGERLINLGKVRMQGMEISAAWQATDNFFLKASCLFNDAKIGRSAISPTLDGNLMPQVSRYSALLSSTWKVSAKSSLRLRVRSESRKFLDSENALPLKATILADLGLTHQLTKHAELYLTADNLFNCRIETSRSSDGLVYTGSPRVVLCGLRLKW